MPTAMAIYIEIVPSVMGGNRTVVIEVLEKRWGKVRLLEKGDVARD